MIEPARLRHVRWIGGPPDAGKSTVARIIAQRHGLAYYGMDRHEGRHLQYAAGHAPDRYPRNAALWQAVQTSEAAFFETWVTQSPAELAESTAAIWTERIGLIVDDLAGMDDRLVIAEGPAFFPAAIVPLLSESHHAVWLLPDEAFKRASHARRGKSAWAAGTSDPSQALASHISRDLIMIGMVRDQLEAYGRPWIAIDDTTPPDLVADRVAKQFGLVRP